MSLGLAIGACTSAFRLVDALLFRSLPVAHPERLYSIAFRSPNALHGRVMTYDSNSYPAFLQMKAVTRDRAKLIAVSYADRSDLTFGADEDVEKAFTSFLGICSRSLDCETRVLMPTNPPPRIRVDTLVKTDLPGAYTLTEWPTTRTVDHPDFGALVFDRGQSRYREIRSVLRYQLVRKDDACSHRRCVG